MTRLNFAAPAPLELLTGADLTKLFPTPRIATDKIPECRPHIQKGEHLKRYRFSPDDHREMVALFTGPHPETGEPLQVAEPQSRFGRVAEKLTP